MQKKYVYKNNSRLKEIRQFLRSKATTAEKILWQHLRGNQLGFKFRRQFSIGRYVADFCCESLKLIVEVDGWTHDGEKTQMKDEVKQKFLESVGYKVVRFKNEEMFGDIEIVWNKMRMICAERAREIGVDAVYPHPASP